MVGDDVLGSNPPPEPDDNDSELGEFVGAEVGCVLGDTLGADVGKSVFVVGASVGLLLGANVVTLHR